MEHLTDNQLLEMLHAPGTPEADAVHLADCADCRRRMAELREGWDLLGQWSIEEPALDLTDAIMSQAQAVRRISLGRPGAWVRVAASIAVGLGLGGLAARPRPASISAQQVSEAIYLEALALDSSTGWASPLLTETEGE